MPKEVTIWETKDGKQFPTEAAAIDYEELMEIGNNLQKFLDEFVQKNVDNLDRFEFLNKRGDVLDVEDFEPFIPRLAVYMVENLKTLRTIVQ